MDQPQKQRSEKLTETHPQGPPNASIAPRIVQRNRPDPSTFHTGSPRPAPRRHPRGAAPPGGAASRPRLRSGPARNAPLDGNGSRTNGPGGIRKPDGRETEKRKGGKKRRSDVVAKWLAHVPGEVMAVLVNMHECYASSVDELRGEVRALRGRMERLSEQEGLLRRMWEGENGRGKGGDVEGEGFDGASVEGVECQGESGVDETTPRHLNMDVPPTLIGERHPVRSTGLKVVKRRPVTRPPLALRQRTEKPATRPSSTDEETPRPDRAGKKVTRAHRLIDNDDGHDDDGLRILDGAPRLCALLRRQHGIASPPKLKSPPRLAHVEPDSNSDEREDEGGDAEYRPGSPSGLPASSSLSAASGASWAPEGSSSSASGGGWRNRATRGSPCAMVTARTASSSSTPLSAPSSTQKRTTRPKPSRATAATRSPSSQQPSSPPPQPPPKTPSPSPSTSASPPSKPRYSTPRRTTLKRTNSGPQYAGKFTFRRMGRTVLSVWNEYKVDGSGGKPFRCIESLEKEYGTCWRTGSVGDIKYASNYVGVRKKIVDFVEGMCEGGKMTPEEACAQLDERVDGRLQALITVLRKGLDPFEAIPVRAGKSVSP
ncbi:hypothetical protein HDV57DRAFT_144723 [Trichoderma longibrachiatum]|uniref:Transcription activator GCR1-like domain-containing protein n=1 Tax=Trichoderma longibrachiatum ATCC 18648 TaxID=983965 RepID=A0A2T4C6T5_TRILO|nr:hypothetical protein M440DRAFT_1208184 [Trichoderma longibrachiatum ATCC 18648]